MKRLTGFFTAALLIVIAGVVITWQMQKETQRDATIVAIAAPAPTPAAVPAPAPAPTATAPAPVAVAPPPPSVVVPFSFSRAVADLSHARPGACLNFTQPLDARPEVHYQDYVKITPAPDAQFRVQDKSLCVEGLVLAKKYKYLRIAYNVFMFGLVIAMLAFVVAFLMPSATEVYTAG